MCNDYAANLVFAFTLSVLHHTITTRFTCTAVGYIVASTNGIINPNTTTGFRFYHAIFLARNEGTQQQ
jgi:hypothetical protein